MISAKVIAHSKSSVNGKEIVTFELVYPRFIHSELMTHRLFSRNAASSRAIPVKKMINMIYESPAKPIRFGANKPGMQDDGVEFTSKIAIKMVNGEYAKVSPLAAWNYAAKRACETAEAFEQAGYHKQVVNRILEPFQWMKTVVTSTEWDNWYWLRNHKDAQPEIKRLAEVMLEAVNNSTPYVLEVGDWHVPYWYNGVWRQGSKNKDGSNAYLEDALAISSSCTAQVSYRTLDDTLEKAQKVVERLNLGINPEDPCHASPTEHQATPMEYPKVHDPSYTFSAEEGITHADMAGNYWSGNFKSFIQYRQLIPGNVYKE